jgi:diguanylate cyclase (GGDEF)-like protein
MALAGLVEYAVGSRQLEHRVLQAALEQQTVHTGHLDELYSGDLDGDALEKALTRELDDVAGGYEVRYVELWKADGTSLGSAGQDLEAGLTLEPVPALKIASVAASQQPVAGREAASTDEGRFEFLLPLDTSHGALVLEVDQDAHVVDGLLGDLRQRKALGLLAFILFAIPLSYVLGGRGLQRRQRVAEHTADTDALTSLAGRRPFRPMLEAELAHAPSRSVALALVDIDEFKQVNDRLGHTHGDRVLVALAASFGVLRASDTAFRLGGDEFAVVLPDSNDGKALRVIERVRGAFAEHAPGVTFSCGVASAGPGEGLAMQELWERADAALYEAKRRGRRQTVTFSATANALTISVDKLDAVRALLDDDCALDVAFQPIWDLELGTVLGHEALLRLPPASPLRGPQEAFDLAQRLGLAAELDSRARETLLSRVASQQWDGLLFLNVHPDALRCMDVAELTGEIARAGLEPADVILEVTEQADLDQPDLIRVLKQLRGAGLHLALDDMGQGNAGLRALAHVRFDVIKIDRAVIARLGADPASDATVAAASTFVQRTGGWVIAEGIEDLRMLQEVTSSEHAVAGRPSVLAGQGYLLGRPSPRPVSIHSRLDVMPERRTQPL